MTGLQQKACKPRSPSYAMKGGKDAAPSVSFARPLSSGGTLIYYVWEKKNKIYVKIYVSIIVQQLFINTSLLVMQVHVLAVAKGPSSEERQFCYYCTYHKSFHLRIVSAGPRSDEVLLWPENYAGRWEGSHGGKSVAIDWLRPTDWPDGPLHQDIKYGNLLT